MNCPTSGSPHIRTTTNCQPHHPSRLTPPPKPPATLYRPLHRSVPETREPHPFHKARCGDCAVTQLYPQPR
ncbi:hypothetical protein BDZ85DRAFT_266085 [Elsinoe ampelina]|uniref:Uncharacterized protein n=1 Tax=Elsinoe ampelina TaxID=302913 RepID=A0A6A6G5J1_9PEZI|nr:hypothetical protein BDZ85DRAFT_266085 [Elsinoe ampelina]